MPTVDVAAASHARAGSEWASLAALGVLIATGSALAWHDLRWDSGTLHVKLALVVTVGVLISESGEVGAQRRCAHRPDGESAGRHESLGMTDLRDSGMPER